MVVVLRYEGMEMTQETKSKGGADRADIYTRITDRIIAALEEGARPWVQPWNAGHLAGRISRPLRHNGEAYSGINVLLLWSESVARGFRSSTWMTFRQAVELGGHVRKGETGSTVVYANRIKRTETTSAGEEIEKDIPFLKAYTVFNLEQMDDLPEDHRPIDPCPPTSEIAGIAEADLFFRNTGAVIRHGGHKAFYSPSLDCIQMPPIETFIDAAGYYATLAHECCHWTASKQRVGRDLSRYSKDRSERAREEVVAELGSVFLCADLGIVPELEPRPDHAAYVKSWLDILNGDKRFIFSAAAHAQRAVAYLHDRQGEREAREAA